MLVPHLQSKLLPPRVHEDLVARARLVDRLCTSESKVWLLSAAAGYGKTSLVVQALDQLDTTVCWFSIDQADNDPVRFWTHLGAAVMGDGEAYQRLLGQLSPNSIDPTADVLLHFIENQENTITIVLDDLHEISHETTLRVLSRILTHPPTNLRVVITTRIDPDLPIGRLRAHGHMVEVRATDLAFTVQEAGLVFADTATETVAEVVRQTEGWPTGLRMVAVAGSEESLAADRSLTVADPAFANNLADFLAAETLSSLRQEQQLFLLETSILDELCPQLCDEILGRTGSLSLLRELARNQVFTSLINPESDTYRYHRLFRDFLVRRSEELDPVRLRELHARTAKLHNEHGDPSATIHHALAAEDYDLALQTIRVHYGPYAQAGRMMTLDHWLESYGRERCLQDTGLRVAAAWVALNIRRYDDIDYWLELAPGEQESVDFAVHKGCVISHRARHLGDIEHALKLAASTVELNDANPTISPEPTGAYGALILANQAIAVFDEELCRRTIAIGREVANDSSIVIGLGALALNAALDNRHDEAEDFADQALAFTIEPVLEWFHQPLAALLSKSLVAMGAGRLADAKALAVKAERIAEMGIEPLMLARIRCQLSVVEHELGHAGLAREQLRQAEAALAGITCESLTDLVRVTGNKIRFRKSVDGIPVELSERELAVLQLLPHGLTRKQLGEQLFVSENTIKTYLTSLRHKLGVTGRSAEIVNRATELGLL